MIKGRLHGLDGGEKCFYFPKVLRIEHARVCGGLVGVVGENIPAGKNQVVQSAQWHKGFDRRSAPVGPFAEADRAQLGQRAHRLRLSGPHQLHAGHEGRAHGAKSGKQNTEFSLGGSDFSWLFHATPFEFAIAHRQSPNIKVLPLQKWTKQLYGSVSRTRTSE